MFDLDKFLDDLETFVSFRTVVCENPDEFRRADAWIRGFFDESRTEFIEFDCHGLTTSIIKPRGSRRPRILGDGHIEVVPAPDEMFALRRQNRKLVGRGVADMKSQCLVMIYALRRLIEEDDQHDFWLVLSEDEEVGSRHGVALVVDYLAEQDLWPPVVLAPDGGPDFSYVEKEKGIMTFEVETTGVSAHASRPFLGDNAIDRTLLIYRELQRLFPNPENERDWRISLSMTSIAAGGASNQIPGSCRAQFDLRFTERDRSEEIRQQIEQVCRGFGADLRVEKADPATYYPREAPVARRYIELLREVSGAEPEILHSAGASNGRIYVAKNPDTHVLMSSPAMGGAHSTDEYVEIQSLPAYYDLIYRTAKLKIEP